jgi:hypothetical protein
MSVVGSSTSCLLSAESLATNGLHNLILPLWSLVSDLLGIVSRRPAATSLPASSILGNTASDSSSAPPPPPTSSCFPFLSLEQIGELEVHRHHHVRLRPLARQVQSLSSPPPLHPRRCRAARGCGRRPPLNSPPQSSFLPMHRRPA